MHHLPEYAPLALAVLLVDLLPLPLLLLQILVERDTDGEDGDMTVADLRRARRLERLLAEEPRPDDRPPAQRRQPPRLVWYRPE